MNYPHENDHPACPIRGEFTPCDPGELAPLVKFLKTGERVAEQTMFRRGAMFPDGRLDLCKQSIGAAGADVVALGLQHHRGTRHLLLGANGLGPEGAKSIAATIRNNITLKTVYLGCNLIDGEATEELVDAIQSGSSVDALWLKRNPIGARGANAVANLLRARHPLKCLDLVHTEMTQSGLEQIMDALIHCNRSVERLYLCGNQITAEECRLIREMLRTNNSLQHLYVSVNQIQDSGAQILAEGLKGNRTLKTLGLASNQIGPRGAEALADVLPDSRLRHLELGFEPSTLVLGEQGNQIGDKGAESLAKALEANPCLLSLDIRRNGITDAGARFLLSSLDQNFTLRRLDLGSGIGRELKSWLNEAMEGRSTNLVGEPDAFIKAIQSIYRGEMLGANQ